VAISIELWSGQQVVGGTESWWDDVELWLASAPHSEEDYPVLSRVDPYEFVVITGDDFPSLQSELERAVHESPKRVSELLARLLDLCRRGADLASPELRFVGD
jgi:PHD/YefM family antitoxin component YafN of YafNO toxin-antitoxin module